jgi:F-type H+-transporting ATPase subunit gamma
MPNAREIKERIGSIEATRKITNAMYLISSTKLRKAKKELADTEPYFYTLQTTIERLIRHSPEVEHIFLKDIDEIPEDKRKKGLIIVTADKGLAGAYNHNILKMADEWLATPGEHTLFVIGEVGRVYFEGKGIPIDTHFRYTAQDPSLNRGRRIISNIAEKYLAGELDTIDIVYTRMVNSMVTEAESRRLLPVDRKKILANIPKEFLGGEEITMEPSIKAVFDRVIPNYLVGFVFGALVESFCSEQNARMSAMQNANDNAADMLRELSIEYNRVRQGAITQEITEVVAGARSQQNKQE